MLQVGGRNHDRILPRLGAQRLPQHRIHTPSKRERSSDRQTEGLTDRQTDRLTKTERKQDKQKDSHTHKH